MLVLEEAAWQAMAAHAERDYPLECCGILLGNRERVARAIAVANVDEVDPRRRFLLDAEAHLRIQREARETGLAVIGFYHSHPDRAVYFSSTDEAECWPGYFNVVVSVRQGRVEAWGAFRVAAGQTETIPLTLYLK